MNEREPVIGRVSRTGTYWTEDGPETGTVESYPHDTGNPEWWEAAVAGRCSHGGHGWDGDTCDDAPMARTCDDCGAAPGEPCAWSCSGNFGHD